MFQTIGDAGKSEKLQLVVLVPAPSSAVQCCIYHANCSKCETMTGGYRVKLQGYSDRRWLRLVGGSLSEFRVSPLLLMLEVYFMLLDAQFYKDVELDRQNGRLFNEPQFKVIPQFYGHKINTALLSSCFLFRYQYSLHFF